MIEQNEIIAPVFKNKTSDLRSMFILFAVRQIFVKELSV